MPTPKKPTKPTKPDAVPPAPLEPEADQTDDELLVELRAASQEARENINDERQQRFFAAMERCCSRALHRRGAEEPTNPGSEPIAS